MTIGLPCLMFSLMMIFDSLTICWVFPPLMLMIYYYQMELFNGSFNMDSMSTMMVFITIWVFMLSFMSMELSNLGMLNIWTMMSILILSFLTFSYIGFYTAFEFAFIFMFIFILGWGKTSERLKASFYMFFYTLLFSMPLLIMLVGMTSNLSSNFFSLSATKCPSMMTIWLMVVFMVKLPLFGLHLWLPKAHVEAPISGSMILAGVLLKLGGYGMIRFMNSMELNNFDSMFFFLALYGSIVVSMICIRQMDIKMLIAYSSVVHMSVVALGILSKSFYGLYGSIMMMVGHALVSPLMFFLMTIFYESMHSRSSMILKGASLSSPVFILFWFLSCSLNLSLPPFMTFFAEVCIVTSLSIFTPLEWAMVIVLCLMTGIYCIFCFISLHHGKSNFNHIFILSTKSNLISMSSCFFLVSYPVVFLMI